MHGGALGSGAPEGKRNGRYLHGAATKAVREKMREMRAWLRIARGALEDYD